ncbi:GntR family transcriptional regulator [Sporosarcina sp. HYO08]|uniref:GntR family transcriptional regulator n=1 Tax=Sporosarcina sp. HYO08 TaxID=1759557 RepID=UPI00079BFF8C|nr:GntR family transcriptional regulator [Sporosarcina sp. HYO08]KXH87135.1 GntR family transcriptional regulator [Sporosarcina sp. HYO08]
MPVPTDLAKPIRVSAKENAFKQLQQWIIDGTLHPGEKLNDTELASALGVSRTPIRESLQLLEVQGFVKMYPGKATQVTEVDRSSIVDLLPPLAALQALSAELAVPHLTDEIIELLEHTNERFAEAVRSKDYFSALKIDEEFHQIIVDTANNQYISSLLSSLQAHVRRMFFHNSIILTDKSIDEHQKVIKLMKDRNATYASTIMRENWLRAIDEFHSLEEAK